MAYARPCKLLLRCLALAAAAQATTWGGLRNQGNTCYLNSLLQTLFHVPALRSDVLVRPAEPRGLMKRLRTAPRPARALTDVFKRLAQNATAQTRGLTRALGVSGLQQQDAQEYAIAGRRAVRGRGARGSSAELLQGPRGEFP